MSSDSEPSALTGLMRQTQATKPESTLISNAIQVAILHLLEATLPVWQAYFFLSFNVLKDRNAF